MIMHDADMRYADMRGADMSYANMRGADMSGAEGVIYAQCSFDGHGECGRSLSLIIIAGEPLFSAAASKGHQMSYGHTSRTETTSTRRPELWRWSSAWLRWQ